MEKLLNESQVAELYGIDRRTLNRWIQEDFIPVVKFSRKTRRFVPSALKAWEADKAQAGRAGARRKLAEVGA
jgi:excisionase family DNA binding protein